jgi:hypothetical protein
MAHISTLFIGMDVHKETIAVAYVGEERGAEVVVSFRSACVTTE